MASNALLSHRRQIRLIYNGPLSLTTPLPRAPCCPFQASLLPQIHGPDGMNFFWLTVFYINKRGEGKMEVARRSLEEADATELLQQVYASDLAKVMFVTAQGDLETVKQWVEDGNDVNAQDREGKTALKVCHSRTEIPSSDSK